MSVRSELRAMTEEERATAVSLLGETRLRFSQLAGSSCLLSLLGATVGFFGGTILLVPFLGALGSGSNMFKGQLTFAVVGLGFALSKALAPVFRRNDRTERLAEDVHGGFVEVLDVEAFIAWREIDREPAFTFDVAAEQPFYAKGAALAPLVVAGTFPCRRFTLVRLPSSRIALACEPRGEPLVPRA
jgi:hypothetical protein